MSKQALLMGGPSPPPVRLDQGWVICKRIIRWAHDDWDMLVISGIDCRYHSNRPNTISNQFEIYNIRTYIKTQVCHYLFAPFTHHLRTILHSFRSPLHVLPQQMMMSILYLALPPFVRFGAFPTNVVVTVQCRGRLCETARIQFKPCREIKRYYENNSIHGDYC